jgi:hypothetical protein
MQLSVQVVIEADGHEAAEHRSVVHEVAHIDRDALSVDTLGLQLAEAKQLLQKVHAVLIDEQLRTCLAEQVACPRCSRARAHTDTKTIVTRTLLGTRRPECQAARRDSAHRASAVRLSRTLAYSGNWRTAGE